MHFVARSYVRDRENLISISERFNSAMSVSTSLLSLMIFKIIVVSVRSDADQICSFSFASVSAAIQPVDIFVALTKDERWQLYECGKLFDYLLDYDNADGGF